MKITFFRDIGFFLTSLVLYVVFLRDDIIDFAETLFLLLLCVIYIASIFILNSMHDKKLRLIQNPKYKEKKEFSDDDDDAGND